MVSTKINRSLQLNAGLTSIEKAISESPISPKKYQALTRQLDHTFIQIQTEKTSPTVASLKEKVVVLYHALETARVEERLSSIRQEARSLQDGRVSVQAVNALEKNIDAFEHDHATLPPERKMLAEAKQALFQAKALLNGNPMNHIDWMEKQRCTQEHYPYPGEVEDLCDIAKAVYDKDIRQAKRLYFMIPEDHKLRFMKHMQNLAARPFDDLLETIQALMATTNELVGNTEDYPSQSQIIQFFLGLSQLDTDPSETGSKICLVDFRHG